jgi:hypothetical protein
MAFLLFSMTMIKNEASRRIKDKYIGSFDCIRLAKMFLYRLRINKNM